ncbi:MAG: APC family permease [Endozoicomonadaceae bacterium]|nr:APC family permease [Endozoicomonadaceae bacterium]
MCFKKADQSVDIAMKNNQHPSLLSAIAIGVSCIIGSGWLFGAYYSVQIAGPASIISWILGALLALMLALLLAEITAMYKIPSLFSRLLTVSHHNRDFSFVVATSNLLGLLIVIPSEGIATVQYLSTLNTNLSSLFFHGEEITSAGLIGVAFLVLLYAFINYWGIRVLTRINNTITIIKFSVPILTGIILISNAFHIENFSQFNGFFSYGVSNMFSAVVQAGIFYSFYGFSALATFSTELKNPKKNIPLALVSSIFLCLIIYLVLQVAFIGSIPTELIKTGWHTLQFNSPFTQLLILIHLNVFSLILYADAAISPSGTALVYSGSSARILTGMCEDKQMPSFLGKKKNDFHFSHRALIMCTIISLLIVLFFKTWQSIVVMITAVQLITCIAIPVAFTKLRLTQPDKKRPFKLWLGPWISLIIYCFVTYLVISTGYDALLKSFIINWFFFFIYMLTSYQGNIQQMLRALLSTWSLIVYMLLTLGLAYLYEHNTLSAYLYWSLFVICSISLFYSMVHQKNYNASAEIKESH